MADAVRLRSACPEHRLLLLEGKSWDALRAKLVRENVAKVYNIPIPSQVQ